jgi:hypothetical protein
MDSSTKVIIMRISFTPPSTSSFLGKRTPKTLGEQIVGKNNVVLSESFDSKSGIYKVHHISKKDISDFFSKQEKSKSKTIEDDKLI